MYASIKQFSSFLSFCQTCKKSLSYRDRTSRKASTENSCNIPSRMHAALAGIDGFEPSTNRLTVYCATAAPYPRNIYILLINSFNSFVDVGKPHDLNHLRIALSDTLYLSPIFTKDFNSK